MEEVEDIEGIAMSLWIPGRLLWRGKVGIYGLVGIEADP